MFVKENRHISKRAGKRLFFSVLATYLLLLAVTISLLVFGYSYSLRQTQQEMEALQVSYLGQIRRELDLRLNAIFRINNFLASYPLTRNVSELEDEQVAYQTFYRELNQVIAEQNALIESDGETALYFQFSDSILTGEYRYRSANLDAYTGQLGFTPEEFRMFVEEIQARGSLRILHPGTPEAELVYLHPIFDAQFQRTGTVLTRLSMSYLKGAINVGNWVAGSICHMEGDGEYFYIDDGGLGDSLSLADAPDYSQVPLDASPQRTKINGENYITVGLNSSVNTWKYYFSIPAKAFFRSGVLYLVWFIATLVLSVFSGVVLSLVFSRRFFRPIHSMLDSLRLDTSVAYPEAMHSLEKALVSYREELSANRNQLLQNNWHKKAGFIWGLCTGRISSGGIASKAAKYHLVLENAPLYLISFRYLEMEKSVFCQEGVIDIDMLLYASCNVIEETLCSQRGAAISHDAQTYCLYQPPQREDREILRKTLEEIWNFHRDTLHVDLQIFCAGYCDSYTDLPEMLFRIEEMVHYKAFWNHDVPDILFYNEISDLTDLKGTSAFMGAEKRFIKLLAIKDYKGAHQVLLESLDAGISKDMKRFPMERFRVFGLLSNLLETLLSQMPVGMEGEETDKLNGALRELLSQRSMEGLREKIDQLFGYVIAYKQQEQSSDAPAWVWKVRSYIEEHYDDPQLDVSLLAKEFSLNVSHLSRTYKKATSVGVLDNIHLVRIARAKEQLDLGCSVQQTSAKVGYLESRALIRAFKRYEGITPGQYQEANGRAK